MVWNMSGTDHTSSAWFNDGNPVGIAWRLAGTGDFTGNGMTDLLWQNADGRLVVWNMNGTTHTSTFALNGGLPVSAAWTVAAVADFNGDGKPDILWRNSDGRLCVWNMNGADHLNSLLMNNGNAVNTAWRVAGVADFNSDGSVDILWQHADGRLLVWYLNRATHVGNAVLNGGSPVNPAWKAVGVSDFDGDENPDVLFQHTDGRLVAWIMNGTVHTSTATVNNGKPVSPVWTVAGLFVP